MVSMDLQRLILVALVFLLYMKKHMKVGRMVNWAACIGNYGMLSQISCMCRDDTRKSSSNINLSLSNLSDLFSLWKKS